MAERTIREQTIIRFIFQNVGGLLALAGVMLSTGMFLGEVSQLKARGERQENTLMRVENKERTANNNSRLNNLEHRINK